MAHKNPRYASGLLPHQIVALGVQEIDDENAFQLANGTYRAICSLSSAMSLRWLAPMKNPRQTPTASAHKAPNS